MRLSCIFAVVFSVIIHCFPIEFAFLVDLAGGERAWMRTCAYDRAMDGMDLSDEVTGMVV